MELTSFYKYLKNTSTGGAVLTEHLPGRKRRPQTPERTRKVSMQLGRMKGEKGVSGTGPGSLAGSWKEETFLNPGKPLHQQGAQKWSFRGSEVSPATSPRQTEQRGLHRRSSQQAGHPAWDTGLLLWTGAGCWDLEFRGLAWGEDWSWLLGGSLKGLERGPAPQGVFLEEAQPSTVATHHG